MARRSSNGNGNDLAEGTSPPNRRRGGRSSRASGSVTLQEVAKLAGVSPITVSRALNRPELVTDDTREKVRRAVARCGYVPNVLARGLASSRSGLIAAVVPSVVNPVYGEVTRVLIDRLGARGYEVFLGQGGYTEASEERLILAILSRRPDGLVITGTRHSPETNRLLAAARIPVVETWDITPTPLDVVVGFSHEKVGRAVAEHLAQAGHRQFAVISADDHRAQRRRAAFATELERRGISEVPTVLVPVPPSFLTGREALGRLLDSGFTSGGIFCSSDTLAHGVLTEARARGLSVPEEVAVVGFGDQEFAVGTVPSLTTVRIHRGLMGERAAAALLERIDGTTEPERVVDVGYELVCRDSA